MSKRQLIVSTIMVISALAISPTGSLSQETSQVTPRLTTNLGVIYVGMPKEGLEGLGFNQDILISHDKEENIEFMTFSDWITVAEGDTITFYIEDGEIKDWFKGGVLMPVDNTGD